MVFSFFTDAHSTERYLNKSRHLPDLTFQKFAQAVSSISFQHKDGRQQKNRQSAI